MESITSSWGIGGWIGIIGTILLIGFAIFMVLRELFCWYWKINRIMEVLEEIRDRLPKTEATEAEIIESVSQESK